MIKRLRFWHYFNRNRFANALACLGSEPVPKNDASLWACYRLGLYKTVVQSTCDWRSWRGGYAKAVSFSAVGAHGEAVDHTRRLVSKGVSERQQYSLANALAPFQPDLSLELIKNINAPATLRTALLLANGQSMKACQVAKEVLKCSEQSTPELELYLSNSDQQSPSQQLVTLNNFLAAHGLSALALKNKATAPGPNNLLSLEELPKVSGPLVSILMTTYQSEERVETSIRSLLTQTWENIELIVIDDDSSDRTSEIVQKLVKEDKRIIYIKLPVNVGTYVAKRIGFEHAKGEFVICHDSDDWSHPLKIERQVRPLIENSSLVFTTAHWVRMQDDGIFYARPVHTLLRLNPASPMFRRELVASKAGLWDLVRTGADSEFLARLKLVFGRKAMHRVVEPLTFGAHRPDSLMTAVSTGHGVGGISPVRLDYWESWTRWHIAELNRGLKPKQSDDYSTSRRFLAPDSICVPMTDVRACLAQ
ncbi:glycosyltransferase family 2 protein [Endozoicomonas montiporae]|uniref:Glycosyl transferase family protein n=1 Tax=Endozoicomonas montiporae CL-33 TaxID=570277 RepID=A0A142BIZ9_9GAMM|nr:glycosyltransferase family 2 protein [Endozoicomonas montiporae]AMO58725.1 glycosyl transferase family protein [Endozoicomonas montiporae CL-33]